MLLITNNPMVANCKASLLIEFYDVDFGAILVKVKEFIIDQRMILLTHPLSGSIKPNETYYKSIILGESDKEAIDLVSLDYIEQALQVYERFMTNKQRPNWSTSVLKDFAYVDYYLMESTFERMLIH